MQLFSKTPQLLQFLLHLIKVRSLLIIRECNEILTTALDDGIQLVKNILGERKENEKGRINTVAFTITYSEESLFQAGSFVQTLQAQIL